VCTIGSVLEPLLFTLYIAPIANVISSFDVCHFQNADDTQLYIALKNSDSVTSLEHCADALYEWFGRNGLSLNPDKSEAIVMGTSARLKIDAPIVSTTLVGSSVLVVVGYVKSLTVTLDSALTLDQHVKYICKSSAYHIRALRHIRKSITNILHSAQSIACSLVGARIDYCSALLYGTSQANIDQLQRLKNSLARIVTGTRKYDHITPTLKQLHWLPISLRINYKSALLTRHKPTRVPVDTITPVSSYQTTAVVITSFSCGYNCKIGYLNSCLPLRSTESLEQLPYDVIDSSASLTVFKQKLKTHMFITLYCM